MSNVFMSSLRNPSPWMHVVAYAAPYFLMMATALYWPENAQPFGLDLTTSPIVRMVPSISAYIDKSAFPHATAAYFFLSGLLAPATFALIFFNPILAHGTAKIAFANHEKYKTTRIKTWAALAVMVPIGSWTSWQQPGYQFGLMPISGHRWALGLFGPLFSFYFQTGYLVLLLRGAWFFEGAYRLERKHQPTVAP